MCWIWIASWLFTSTLWMWVKDVPAHHLFTPARWFVVDKAERSCLGSLTSLLNPKSGPVGKIQTFPNLLLNKLATLRAADRPFIVVGRWPNGVHGQGCCALISCLGCHDRWAVERVGRRRGHSPPQGFTSLCPPVHPHLTLLPGPSGVIEVEVVKSWWWKVKGALSLLVMCSPKYTKNAVNVSNTIADEDQWWSEIFLVSIEDF